MTRIQPVNVESQSGKSAELLAMLRKKLGRVPNMLATLANSTAALEGYMNFSSALAGGTLTAKEREQIAVLVGTRNDCGYCVAAHSAIGKMAGLTESQVQDSKLGKASTPREQAILNLASAIVERKGFVQDQDLAAARNAGLTDGEVLEIVGNVSLNIYTNYINHVADPVVDF